MKGIHCNYRGGECFNPTCAIKGKCVDLITRTDYYESIVTENTVLKKELYELKELLPDAIKEYEELKKQNEELKVKLSGKTFFDEKEVLEAQLDKAKERIEFLEMQVKSLQGKNRTEPPF